MLRLLTTSLLLLTSVIGTPAIAENIVSPEIIKTGILPAGGFYRIYEVTCRDETIANVATLQGRANWCVNDSGELTCYSDSRQAADKACGSVSNLAAVETDSEKLVTN